MSQMSEAAASWPEEGAQYVPGAPMEPAHQGAYPPHQQQYPAPSPQYPQAQQYPQQGYQDPQYAQQPYQGGQPAYQQPGYQDQTVPQPAVFAEPEQSSVPSEFDHLFRDSSPENRKSISGRPPMVSGPGAAASPGFQQQAATQSAQATAVYAPPQQQPFGGEQAPADYGQQQPFGGGYGGPGGPGEGGNGSGNRRTPLIIGGVVVAIAAVGLYLGLSGGGGAKPQAGASTAATHASNETPKQQAAAVYALVQKSETLRSDINAQVGSLISCSNVGALQAEINTTAQGRQQQADQVAKLDVSKISGGAALVSALHTAWADSAKSDAEYAKAAGDFANGGCTKDAVRADPNFKDAVQVSNHVTGEKSGAVTQWNNIMTNYGLPKISQDDL